MATLQNNNGVDLSKILGDQNIGEQGGGND